MDESTVELEISLLVPGVQDDGDGCLVRLEQAMQQRKGITRAHVERGKPAPTLCFHYDPALVSIDDVRRMAARAGASIANRYHHDVFHIEGMDCSDCAFVVEHGLARAAGVLNASVNYVSETLHIEYDAQQISRREIVSRVDRLGYHVPANGMRRWYEEYRELILSLMAGILLATGWLGERFFGFPTPLSVALYLAAYLAGGLDVAHHALQSLRERHFDTDLLMVVAALGAAVLGDFAEGALLLFLFSLGHALEERALDRARGAIRALSRLAPKTALVRQDGAEVEIPIEQVPLAAVVVVKPGVRIPVDGEVLAGQSAVDQSPVTGESVPVDKSKGDKLYAGSVNGEGALEVRVTRLAKDSTLARVTQMVEQAQGQKSPTQQLTERFTGWFVPAVLIGDVLLIIVPPLFGVPFAESFLRAMTLLVAASPCALALGTPATILAGVAQAARHGVLVKGGAHLENLGRLRALAFDKTGTITRGKPELTDTIPFAPHTGDELLALAAAVESRSAHPLAQAVVREARARGLTLPDVGETTALTGRGIKAQIENLTVWVGNSKLFFEAGIALSAETQAQVIDLEEQGKTVMVVSAGREPAGIIAVADVVRSEAKSALTALRMLGIERHIMLTGDNERVAGHVARQAGLSEYRANLMPEDKVGAIRALVQQHGAVAMVGDGVNDAPALASSTVGIAMGGAGTDVALETSDVALMADDLAKLPFAVGLGRATRAIIMQNLAIAFGVIALLILSSIAGLAGIGVAIIFHEGSTLLGVVNALRLLTYEA